MTGVSNDEKIAPKLITEEYLNKDILEKVLKKLDDSNFVSIFFLLVDYAISSQEFLYIIELNRIEKENYLRRIFQIYSKTLIIDLLGTIKRFDLTKLFNICRHSFHLNFSSLQIMWKSLYEVCESFEMERDVEHLKKAFKEVSIPEEGPSEIFFIKAYDSKLISKVDLENLLNDLNKENQISKTWALNNEFYSIKSPTIESPCGLALIINHENFHSEENDGLNLVRRKDSPLDVEALKKLWKSFGFEVQTHLNLKAEEILNLFENLSQKDLSSYDIFVTCYMSHGDKGIVYTSDCQAISISCLVDYMANKCKTLVNKPKLFFIQACQGKQIQYGNSFPILSRPSDSDSCLEICSSNLPLFVDVLVAISSISGFVSFASDGKNCWFIEALIENMEKYGDKLSILDILVKVNNQVSKKNGTTNIQGHLLKNCKQTVEQKHTLRKSLRLKKLLEINY